MPRTVPKSTRERSATGSVSKNAMFVPLGGDERLARSTRLIALRAGSPGATTGQASTHSAQPVQSST